MLGRWCRVLGEGGKGRGDGGGEGGDQEGLRECFGLGKASLQSS